jgi:hypothetical protein
MNQWAKKIFGERIGYMQRVKLILLSGSCNRGSKLFKKYRIDVTGNTNDQKRQFMKILKTAPVGLEGLRRDAVHVQEAFWVEGHSFPTGIS